MTTLREAAQQALEALDLIEKDIHWTVNSPTRKVTLKAITALRAALEQPEQEPVAWLFTDVQSGDIEVSTNPDEKEGERERWNRQPLYKKERNT